MKSASGRLELTRTVNVSASIVYDVAAGTHTYAVRAVDGYGNVGPAAQILIDVIGHHVNKGSSPAEAAEAVRTALNSSIESVAQDHWIDQLKKGCNFCERLPTGAACSSSAK